MRSDKDAANAKAEGWLTFIWIVSIALGVALIGLSVLSIKTVSMHIAQRRELAYRQDVAHLLCKGLTNQLPADQAATVVLAFNRAIGIDAQEEPDTT